MKSNKQKCPLCKKAMRDDGLDEGNFECKCGLVIYSESYGWLYKNIFRAKKPDIRLIEDYTGYDPLYILQGNLKEIILCEYEEPSLELIKKLEGLLALQ